MRQLGYGAARFFHSSFGRAAPVFSLLFTLYQKYIEHMPVNSLEVVKIRKQLHDPAATLEQKVALAERLADRPLSQNEKIMGKIHRHDNRPMLDRIAAESWRPVPAAPPTDALPFAAELAEAEASAREEIFARNFAGMSPSEKEVYTLKRLQTEELQARATQAAVDAERQRRKPMVDALEALQAKMQLDPLFTFADQIAVEQALAQCSTPGSCDIVAKELTDKALSAEARIQGELVDGLKSRLSEAQQQLLEAQLALGIQEQPPALLDEPKSYIDDPEYQRLHAVVQSDEFKSYSVAEWKGVFKEIDTIKAKYPE